MDPITMSAVIAGGAQLAGGLLSNATNWISSNRQMKFQEGEADSTYQRTTKDMIKAGINPGLLYSKGASMDPSPIGSAAVMQNPAAGIGSASQFAALANLKKQGELLDAQKHKTDTESSYVSMQELMSRLQVPREVLLSDFYRDHPNWGLGMLLAREIGPAVGSVSQLANTFANLRKVPGASRIVDSMIDPQSGVIKGQTQRDITY